MIESSFSDSGKTGVGLINYLHKMNAGLINLRSRLEEISREELECIIILKDGFLKYQKTPSALDKESVFKSDIAELLADYYTSAVGAVILYNNYKKSLEELNKGINGLIDNGLSIDGLNRINDLLSGADFRVQASLSLSERIAKDFASYANSLKDNLYNHDAEYPCGKCGKNIIELRLLEEVSPKESNYFYRIERPSTYNLFLNAVVKPFKKLLGIDKRRVLKYRNKLLTEASLDGTFKLDEAEINLKCIEYENRINNQGLVDTKTHYIVDSGEKLVLKPLEFFKFSNEDALGFDLGPDYYGGKGFAESRFFKFFDRFKKDDAEFYEYGQFDVEPCKSCASMLDEDDCWITPSWMVNYYACQFISDVKSLGDGGGLDPDFDKGFIYYSKVLNKNSPVPLVVPDSTAWMSNHDLRVSYSAQ